LLFLFSRGAKRGAYPLLFLPFFGEEPLLSETVADGRFFAQRGRVQRRGYPGRRAPGAYLASVFLALLDGHPARGERVSVCAVDAPWMTPTDALANQQWVPPEIPIADTS